MSRLYNCIREAQQPIKSRVPLFPMPTVTVDDKISRVGFEEAFSYRLGAVFEVRATCRKQDLDTTLNLARRRIVEDVFGEFRGPIMGVYDALFDRDIESAVKALGRLERLLFTDEVAS